MKNRVRLRASDTRRRTPMARGELRSRRLRERGAGSVMRTDLTLPYLTVCPLTIASG
jgi:hypothetical protein